MYQQRVRYSAIVHGLDDDSPSVGGGRGDRVHRSGPPALGLHLRDVGEEALSRLANAGLLAAAREVRGMEESRTRVPKEPGTMHVGEVQPNRGASIIAADLGHDAERLDAVAGSEFVDDRIRLRE